VNRAERSQISGASLIEQWNGTTWSMVANSQATGAAGSILTGVACSAGSICFAVGGYEGDIFGTRTLVERYG
jgi:hypothetical protein